MINKIHSRKYLKAHRKNPRNNPTSAEAVLWTYLQSKKLEGRKFRRQQSIQNYIVDFYCPEEDLIIELDGAGHDNTGGQVADEYRDVELQKFGFKILRFENIIVFENFEGLPDEIKSNFKKSGM